MAQTLLFQERQEYLVRLLRKHAPERKYDADEVQQIKLRIKRAAKQHGVEIEEDS